MFGNVLNVVGCKTSHPIRVKMKNETMETKEFITNQLPPKTLQRVEKLKVYAILSGEKGEALKAVKDKLVLSLILAYNDSEAVMAANKMVQGIGRQPETYQIPFMFTKADIEKLIPELNNFFPHNSNFVPNFVEGEVEATPMEKMDHIKEVFNKFGTATQQKMANAVIRKYEKHAKYLPKYPFETN